MLIVSFLLTCLLIELTPGPNMAYLAILSSQRGRRAGFSVVAGVAAGLGTVGAAALLGAAAVIMESPALYALLHWSGVVYLLWLAWEIWQGRDDTAMAANGAGIVESRFFRRGFITNLLNPKAALFFITVFPYYVNPEAHPVLACGFLGLYLLIATSIHGGIVLLAGRLRPWLTRTDNALVTRRVFAVLLAGMALWMAR